MLQLFTVTVTYHSIHISFTYRQFLSVFFLSSYNQPECLNMDNLSVFTFYAHCARLPFTFISIYALCFASFIASKM